MTISSPKMVVSKSTFLVNSILTITSFPDVQEFKIQYIMKRLNCERDEALTYLKAEDPDKSDETED